MSPEGAAPPSRISSQASLFAELAIFNRERPLSGPLHKLLEINAEGSPGVVQAGEVMQKAVAPGGVAAVIDPRRIFAPAVFEDEEIPVEAAEFEEAGHCGPRREASAASGGDGAICLGSRRPCLGSRGLVLFRIGFCVIWVCVSSSSRPVLFRHNPVSLRRSRIMGKAHTIQSGQYSDTWYLKNFSLY